MAKRICSFAGCDRPIHARGLCNPHWQQSRRGPLKPLRETITPEQRFRKFIQPDDRGCWIWTGTIIAGTGYGQFWLDGGKIPAHRFAYSHFIGPIPDGLVIDHLCRVPACVNPDHLEPVTPRENVMRGLLPSVMKARAAKRTQCIHGHDLFGPNLYLATDGARRCRTCGRAARARYRARVKARKLETRNPDT